MASEEEKKIVLERLLTMPPNLKLSLGRYGSFDKNQLREEIENGTDVGKIFVKMHMEYLRSFKKEIK